jgi:adenylate kinase
MRSILITGVSASGKTTLSHEVSHRLGITAYDYADLMLKAEPSLPGKDAIDAIDDTRRQAIYSAVTGMLAAWFGPGSTSDATVLLENHLSVITGGKIVTFRTTAYRRYSARGLAVINAGPETILSRRIRDPARSRQPGTADLIDRQQKINLGQAELIADYLAIPMLLVDNDDLAVAADKFTTWVRGLTA